MTSAVIVSTARTPLAKSWKGAFNLTHGATLGGHAVQHAIARAGIDAAEVEDVIEAVRTGVDLKTVDRIEVFRKEAPVVPRTRGQERYVAAMRSAENSRAAQSRWSKSTAPS